MADTAAAAVATYFAIQGYHVMFSTGLTIYDSVTVWDDTPVLLPGGYNYSRQEVRESGSTDEMATTFYFDF